MAYNLADLLQSHDLEHLGEDITAKDIQNVIRALPYSQLLGLMGSMVSSLKNVGTSSKLTSSGCINYSHIAFITKTQNPIYVDDN